MSSQRCLFQAVVKISKKQKQELDFQEPDFSSTEFVHSKNIMDSFFRKQGKNTHEVYESPKVSLTAGQARTWIKTHKNFEVYTQGFKSAKDSY